MANVVVPWDGWEIVGAIGKGGYGKVYEIRRSAYGFQESAAMKVLTVPHDEEEIECLRAEGMDEASITHTLHGYVGDIVREYQLMIGLKNCPNIVHCDDYQVIRHEQGLGWNVYIKMELLAPLMKVLDHVSTEAQILKLAKDLCYALVTCQKQNVLHRDIKPQNIFMASDGNFKLGDFGIARTVEHTTHATAGIGTYSYMAPEVLSGSAYGPQADIYSLGMVLYWLLNKRRHPFLPLPPKNYNASMAEEARRRRFRGEPLFPPADGSSALKRIVLKACAFDPKDRYISAWDMMQALVTLDESTEIEDPKAHAGEDVTVLANPTLPSCEIEEQDDWYEGNYDADEEDNAEDWKFPEVQDGEFDFRNFAQSFKEIVFTKWFAAGVVIAAVAAIVLVVLVFGLIFHFVGLT